jgi:steroid delta-isomerase-like uncharacterized protein
MTQRNLERLDDFWRHVNAREFDAAMAFYGPDAVLTMLGRELSGLNAIKNELVVFVEAFPDAFYEPRARSADPTGDVIVEEWSVRGTHLGPFMGHPPTGARVGFDAVTIYEFEDGLIRRDRTYADMSRVLLGTGVLQRSGRLQGGSP